MRSIVLEEPGRLVSAPAPEPGRPGPGEALVRVRRVGICGTDLHAFRGRQPFFDYPRILGHELGVEVEEVGEGVEELGAGDRCAVEPYLECGRCVACRRGKTNCCAALRVLGVHVDGGMRERVVVPARKLHRSETLALEQLALVETLGIGAHAVARADIGEGEGVLVVGAGPIGLAVVQFALIAGARVAVLEANDRRAAFSSEHFGIERAIVRSSDPVTETEAALGGDLPTAVFDATGSADSMMDMASFRCVANGGRLVFVGLCRSEVAFSDPEFHRKEVSLLASRNSTAADFERVLGHIEGGRIDTRPWITHRAHWGSVVEEFPRWLDPGNGVVKAMLEL